MTISVVLVTWEPGEEILTALASLRTASDVASPAVIAEMLVIDNASRDLPAEAMRERWPELTLRRSGTNVGFAAAANRGAELARGAWLLFVNPDVIAEPDSLAELGRGILANPEAVALAPRLLPASPSDADPAFRTPQLRRLPTLADAARHLLLVDAVLPRNPGLRRHLYGDLDPAEPAFVEQPAAAALAVRRDVFGDVGGFDERFHPAWFEDVDLCRRLLSEGGVLYWPASRFIHGEAVSASKLGLARFLPLYHRNGLRYFGVARGAVGATAYRLLLVTGMLLRLVALVLPTRRRRPGAARAYLRVLRGALGLGWPANLPEARPEIPA